MTLSDYLKLTDQTDEKFAAKIGVNRSTVTRIRHGNFPSKTTIDAIVEETGGKVTANDLMVSAA